MGSHQLTKSLSDSFGRSKLAGSSTDDESLMGGHQETQSFSDSGEFSDSSEFIVYYDMTPRPGEFQLWPRSPTARSTGIHRAPAENTMPFATKPVLPVDREENSLMGIHELMTSHVGKENTRLVPNSGKKGPLVKSRALHPPGKRASDVNEASYPIKRATDTKEPNSDAAEPVSTADGGERSLMGVHQVSYSRLGNENKRLISNANEKGYPIKRATEPPVDDEVNQAHEHEWPTPPSHLCLQPPRTTITYPGWNQSWNVARYSEYEMELKYGPLRHTRRPWLDDYDPQARGFPWTAPDHNGKAPEVFLYDPSHIYNMCDKEREGEMFYIDLFFQHRFYSSKTSVLDRKSPAPLAQSWAAFVRELTEHPSDRPSDYYIEKVKKERKKFEYNTANGAAMRIHRISMKDVSVCTVPASYRCPSCYTDLQRLKLEDITPKSRISTKLELAHFRLNQRLNLSINARTGNSVFSECDTAELRRFDRMLSGFQETNAELVAAAQQSERKLKTLEGEYTRLSLREGILTQNFKDVMKEILELRYRLDQNNS